MGRSGLVLLFAIVAAAGAAHAGTGGSTGGGSWQRSSTPSYTPPASPSPSPTPFTNLTFPAYTPPSLPVDHGAAPSPSGSGSGLPPPGWDRPSFPEHHDFLFDHFGLVLAMFFVFILALMFRDWRPRPDRLDRALAHADDTDVSVLRVAIDGRARRFVQAGLAQIAATANADSAEGRVKLLREVALMLRRLRDAWVYGGAVNEPIRAMEPARAAFVRHVDDARSRFREETIRNEGGVVTRAPASAYTPQAVEGDGLILVSLVIAARQDLFTVKTIANGDELRRALEAAGSLDVWNLVAVEIVWEPSLDSDRLSSIELEAKYPAPELVPIDGALVGKTFCAYCGGPYPAELVSCPHCSAPAKRAA